MDLPAELRAVQPVKVERARNRVSSRPLVIAGVPVSEHRRGWTRGRSSDAMFPVPEIEATKESTPYRFLAGPWKVQCYQTASGTRIDTPRGDRITIHPREDLKCALAGGPQQWTLEMKSGGSLLTGDAMSGEDAILIRPATAHAGSLNLPGGWVFNIGGRPVAALEIAGGEFIRFAPDATAQERELITALAAALLLYEP